MLKHLGACRAGGGQKPPKSEGGGSERQRAREGSEKTPKSEGDGSERHASEGREGTSESRGLTISAF